MSLYDIACLQRPVAIRAVFKLWRKGAWPLLDELGLDRSIQRPFEDAMDYLPYSQPRNDAQTEMFLAALPDSLRERVILAADILINSYRWIFQEDLANDSMLKGVNNGRCPEAGKEQRPRKRGRSRR